MSARRLVVSVSAAVVGVLLFSSAPALATPPKAYVTEVTSDSATLHAVIDPEGSATTYRFEYGPSSEYGSQTPQESAGEASAPVSVEAHLQGLSAASVYHFHVVASNAAHGTADSEDLTFTTQATGSSFSLPDNRQYEMVTPPEKEGALFFGLGHFYEFGFGVIQASVVGNAIVDRASVPTESEPQGYSVPSVSVLSTRGPGGWSSRVIEPPHGHGTVPADNIGWGGEYRVFSEDLSRGVVQSFGDFTPYSPEASEQTPYVHTNYLNGNVNEACEGSYLTSSSCFRPVVTAANTLAGTVFGETPNGVCREVCGPRFYGASPDLSHIIVASPGAGPGLAPAQLTSTPVHTQNALYEWYDGNLRLISVFPVSEENAGAGSRVTLAGTAGQGIGPTQAGNREGAGRAVSENGERVIFEVANPIEPLGLYLRENSMQPQSPLGGKGECTVPVDACTVRVDVPEEGATAVSGAPGYMRASRDASRIFFIDSAGLTKESSAGGVDLYEYDVEKPEGERLTDLTVDPHAGEGSGFVAFLGASDDGSYVYFEAGGALTPGTVQVACGFAVSANNEQQEGCNVYVRHDGVTSLVAAAGLAMEARYPASLSRVSPDGRWLAFMSSRSPTGYDNRDAISGQPDDEVYLYDAVTGRLSCASCDPTGARPVGEESYEDGYGWAAANVTPWKVFENIGLETLYQPRYLSDSGRLFFESHDALVPADVNGTEDVYEYEPEGVPGGERTCSSFSASASEVFKPAHVFDVGGVKGEEGAGCVALISSGISSEASSFLDASESGGDVFILTSSQLTSVNAGGANVYDAHECTAASPCTPPPAVQPPACTTEASCKTSPTPQPSIYGLPSSATFAGPGNIVPPPPSKTVTRKTVKCKKGFVKNKKGECVKKPRKRHRAKKASTDRRAE